MQGSCPTGNLSGGGRRARMVSGVVSLAIGGAVAALLIAVGARWWWRLIVVIPFWVGALGVLQARAGT